jgi:type I restriction enzyme S subunit
MNDIFPRHKIGEIATVASGSTPARAQGNRYFSDSGYEWVKTGDLNNSLVKPTAERITEAAISETNCRVFPVGTVLVAMYGGLRQIGRTGLLARPAAVNQAISAIQVDRERMDPEYLLHYLNFAVKLWKQLAASSRKDPNITRKDVMEFSVPVPPLSEQRKIAEILHTWDEAIDGITRIRRSKSSQLERLRTSVFDTRSGLAIGWPTSPLRSIADRVISKSAGELHPVMAISAKSGFELQSTKYSRDMAGANLANYTLLRRGEFAYNKGNSLTYPQGCIYQLDEDSALVPNVYFSFKLDEELNSSFFGHYFAAGGLNRQLAQRISSGVRGNGLLNLNPADFFDVKVPVPDLPIQDTVASLLSNASRELALLDRELNLLSRQKSGLMQKLLTGEVRVNAEMEQYS